MLEKIVVFGAGGHAKVVIDAIECEGRYAVAFLADADALRSGTTVLGYPVRSERDGLAASAQGITRAIVAIGNNAARRRIADAAMAQGLQLTSVIHPAAVVARSARIGCGTLVMPGCVINADAQIGDNVIINTAAVIEHDCVVGDDAHIAPNVTLCGGSTIGRGTLVGVGACVLPGVSVGAACQIGAGATVITDIADGVTAAGTPCRTLEKRA
jgi:acetyltransferase EpsM